MAISGHEKSILRKVVVRFMMRLVVEAFDSWRQQAAILVHRHLLLSRCLARLSHLVSFYLC